MSLSNDIISQFVKITNDSNNESKKDTITYGVVSKKEGDKAYVILDGTRPDGSGNKSAVPVSTTVAVNVNDRVIVMIKNHSAVVTGNLGNPATTTDYVDTETGKVVQAAQQAETKANEANNKVTELSGTVIAVRADVEELTADVAAIENLETDSLLAQTVKANKLGVNELKAKDVEIEGKLEADEAVIESLKTDKLSVEDAEVTYATITSLEASDAEIESLKTKEANFEKATSTNFEAINADIQELETNKLDSESAKIIYANIDFSNIGKAAIEALFSKSGMITNLVVGDGTITGELVGVTISGDLVKGNTIKADKLVVKGSDGLYYKLNIDAGATTSAEVTETDLQNGLHGTAIIAKTITADKISVSDLVAFGADIAGFHITEQNTFYSGAKSAVDNTTQGIYLDAAGQANIGDSNNFIKYYKAADGSYRLEISANSIVFGASKKSVETTINEVKTSIDNLEIGGSNLVPISRIQAARNVSTTKEFELRNDWASVFINAENLAAILEPGTEYYIRYNLELIERTDVPTPFDMRAGFLIYREGVWVDIGTYAFAEDAQIGDVATVSKKFKTPDEWNGEQIIVYSRRWTTEGSSPIGFDAFKVTNFKIEKGTKPTAWSPAPEDLATADAVSNAQLSAENADERAANAESLIEQLADSISMLVTDGNGASLMTQTENGWTFSTGDIQSLVNDVSNGLGSLTEEVGSVNGVVEILQQAVTDLGEIAEYVKITTYEDEPCIELGEGDSEFKLRITNTQMMFTEGSTLLAYFTNQAFNSKKVVIEEELQQGGFVWAVRANGNLGLTWKGGND